jgi:hypothetical protein
MIISHIPTIGELLLTFAFVGYWLAYFVASRLRSRELRAKGQVPRYRDAIACAVQAIAASIAVLLTVGYGVLR